MSDIYKDATILPPGLKTLAEQLKDLTGNQKSFIIQHFMRAYVKSPALFDMVYEAQRISIEIKNGTLIGGKNYKGEENHDKFFVKSMSEQGFWLAEARMLVVSVAHNEGNAHKSTTEILSELSERVEGSKIEATGVAIRILNSVLRLAGFKCNTFYRKQTKDTARCWKLKEPTDTLEICLSRLEEKLTEELKIWEQ